ncbi:MAG: hypothetical protein DRP83_07200 [Planctomycetota bacterium]|nr:MAG: hypothetical protein DRP83_07200 [Planctomycetota bacterium]
MHVTMATRPSKLNIQQKKEKVKTENSAKHGTMDICDVFLLGYWIFLGPWVLGLGHSMVIGSLVIL